ncbi:MAG: PAS domain S-box protein, partial [candidate division NC10 bacterium]|nr:PAS domain S-box protein [candidate division NC10 bacterium]
PVIFISAKSSVDEKLRGLKMGAEDYLTKPVTADEVLAKVKLWLRVKAAEEALWERNRELSALLESSAVLTSSLDLAETLRRIIQVAQALLPSVCATIMLLNEREELIVSAHANFPQEWLEDLQSRPLKVGESLAGWVALHREVLSLPDPLSNSPHAYRSAHFAKKFGIVSYLGIPLTVGERLIGVLNFNSFENRRFTPEQIALISAFGQHAAIAIDNARAYAQIREAEESLSNLVENSQDAIISLDLDGIIRLWNGGAEKIYGHAAKDTLGQSIEIIVPDPSREEEKKRRRRMVSEGSPEVFRGSRRCRDGKIIPVLATWSLIRDNRGRPRAISLIEKDISELCRMEETIRESRRKLWGIIDGITDFLYVVDRAHRICQINRPYATYLQQSPQSLVGRLCYESLRGQQGPCPDCMVGEVLKKGGLVRGERKERTGEGQERIWEVSAFPILMG